MYYNKFIYLHASFAILILFIFFPLVHRFSFLYFFLCKWERTFVSIKLGLRFTFLFW